MTASIETPRLSPGLRPTDIVFIVFNAGVLMLLLFAREIPDFARLVALQITLIAAPFLLARLHQLHPLIALLREWYTILALGAYFPILGLLRHGVFPNDLDPYFISAEVAIFGQEFYRALPARMPLWLHEITHAVYASHYFMIFIPGMIAFRARPELTREYIFTMTLTVLSIYFQAVIFPVSGPTHLRQVILPEGVVFIPFVTWIQNGLDYGGAAFPSTHSAGALIYCTYCARFFPRLRWLFFVQMIGIQLSTVLCVWHYFLDTIAGAVTALIFYHLIGPPLYKAYLKRAGQKTNPETAKGAEPT